MLRPAPNAPATPGRHCASVQRAAHRGVQACWQPPSRRVHGHGCAPAAAQCLFLRQRHKLLRVHRTPRTGSNSPFNCAPPVLRLRTSVIRLGLYWGCAAVTGQLANEWNDAAGVRRYTTELSLPVRSCAESPGPQPTKTCTDVYVQTGCLSVWCARLVHARLVAGWRTVRSPTCFASTRHGGDIARARGCGRALQVAIGREALPLAVRRSSQKERRRSSSP